MEEAFSSDKKRRRRLFNRLVDNEMIFFSLCNFPLFCLRLRLQLFPRVKCESKWTFGILHVSKPRCSDVGKAIRFLHEVHSY
uniref:Uncharacterized protein n=1 Tax=Solanum lycopersicum TaxID=4081 RepID=A0A3Q7F7Q7_SOLLC